MASSGIGDTRGTMPEPDTQAEAVASWRAFRQSLSYADAIDAKWSGGDWRKVVARGTAPQWEMAQSLTAQEAAGAGRDPLPGGDA
jgi:hypothetical protein